MSDSLEDLYQRAMEIRNEQIPPANNPYGGYAPAIGQSMKEVPTGPGLLHGLVDDATLKAWLIHEIQLLSDLIADDDRSITREQERLESFLFRRDRLTKLRQAFETLRDDIVATEGG